MEVDVRLLLSLVAVLTAVVITNADDDFDIGTYVKSYIYSY